MTSATTDPLLKKLNHRPGVPVLVLWAPDEVSGVVAGWEAAGVGVGRRLKKGSPFVLAFVRSCQEIAERAPSVVGALGGEDPVLWFAYPKKSSKRYRSDVGRDDSWQPLGDVGFEPVRQVAVDEDWSALRFRRVSQVKTLTRSRAISAEGRSRIAGSASADPPEVAAWLDGRDEPRRSDLRAVHELVRSAAPELAPEVAGKMLGYGPFHYVYESGREGDAHRIALADNARYISLYVLAGDEGGYLAEQHADRLGKVSVGKSCVRFKRFADVDADALGALVRAAAATHGPS